jgi:hypothetical protein
VIIVSEPSQIALGLAADYRIISDLGFPAIYTLRTHQLLDERANISLPVPPQGHGDFVYLQCHKYKIYDHTKHTRSYTEVKINKSCYFN